MRGLVTPGIAGWMFGNMGLIQTIASAFTKELPKPGSEGEQFLTRLLGPTVSPSYVDRKSRAILKNCNDMPWLMAATNRVAEQVASASWKIGYLTKEGKPVRSKRIARMSYTKARAKALKSTTSQAGMDYVEVDNHPMLDLLHHGCGLLDGRQIIKLQQASELLVGEAAWWVQRDNPMKVPTDLWPLPSYMIDYLPNPTDPYYHVTMPTHRFTIPASEVIYFRNPNNYMPYGRGTGFGQVLADEAETDEFCARYIKAYFLNGAVPSHLISGKFSKSDTDRLESSWMSKHAGFWNRHKPHFLGGASDLRVDKLSDEFNAAGMIQLRKHGRDTIMQVFGLPPETMGIIEHSNRATVDAAFFLLCQLVTIPRLEALRSALQEQLILMYDERYIVDYEDPTPENKDAKQAAMVAAPWAYSADEWRELADFPPLPDGNGQFYMVPVNLISTRSPGESMPEPPISPVSPAVHPAQAIPDSQAPHKTVKASASAPLHAPSQSPESAPEVAPLGAEEEALELTTGDITSIADAANPDVLITHMRPVITDVVVKFGDLAIQEAGLSISFDLSDPNVIDFLRTQSSDRITGLVNETTRDALRSQLSDGVDAGESFAKLQDRITGVFDQADGYRSYLIARTETVRAANFGAIEGMRDADTPEKEWVSVRGGNRPDHEPGHSDSLDGQHHKLGDLFKAPSGKTAPYPGGFGFPEEDCNCRCRVIGYYDTKALHSEEQKAMLWKSFENLRAPQERRMIKALRSAFTKQRAAVMKTLQHRRNTR